jgi:hypothetical protein
LAANLEAVHLWHEQIEEDEIGPASSEALKSLEAAGCRENLKPELAERGANHLDV